MNYSDQDDSSSGNGWFILGAVFIAGLILYFFLWEYVYSEFKGGFYSFFQSIHHVNIDEAEKYSARLAFIAAAITTLSIALGLFLRSGKPFLVTAMIILSSVAFGFYNSHTIRDERLVSVDTDGLQKYFCTDKISGPYAVKGENCKISKLPGEKPKPAQIWSYIAMLDKKSPTKLTLTSQELKDLALSDNGSPVIFVSPTVNRDGLYDIYRGAGAGIRNLAGTTSDVLIAANESHITHNLQQMIVSEKLGVLKLLSEKENAKNVAYSELQTQRNKYQSELESKRSDAQLVKVEYGSGYKLQPGTFVSELLEESALIVTARQDSLQGSIRFVGQLTEEAQAPYANRLVVINQTKRCKWLSLGCADVHFKLQMRSDEARAELKKAEINYNEKEIQYNSVLDRIAKLKKLSENEGVSFNEAVQAKATTPQVIKTPAPKIEQINLTMEYFFVDFYKRDPSMPGYIYPPGSNKEITVTNAGSIRVYKTGVCYNVQISVDDGDFEPLCNYSRGLNPYQTFTIRNQERFTVKSKNLRDDS